MPARVYELQVNTKADTGPISSLATALSGLDAQGKQLGQGWAGLDKLKEAAAEMAEIKERIGSSDYGFLPPGALERDLERMGELRTELKQLEAEAKNVGSDFREFTDALKISEQATISQAKAAGLSKDELKKISAVYDELRIKSRLYQQETTAGRMSPMEAGRKLADDLTKVSQAADLAGKKLTETGHEAKEGAKGMDEAARGAGEFAKKLVDGASDTELMSTGLETVGGLMMEIPVWGAFAGIAIQTLTAIFDKWSESTEEEVKQQEALADKVREQITDLNNAKVAQQEWETSIKKTTTAMELQRAEMDRLHKAQAEERDRAAKLKEEQRQDDERERKQMHDDGKISDDDLVDDKITDDAKKLADDRQKKLDEIAQQEDEAQQRKAEAQAEFQAREKDARDAETKYDAAKHAATAEFQAKQAKEDAAKLRDDADTLAAVGDVDPAEIEKIRKEAAAREQSAVDAQGQADALGSAFGPFVRDKKTGEIDKESAKKAAEQKRREADEARPGLSIKDAAAQADIDAAQRAREDVNHDFDRQRDEGRGKVPEGHERHYDRMNETLDEQQGREQQEERDRKRQDEIKGEKARAKRGGGDAVKPLADAVQEGTNPDDVNKIVAALQQHLSSYNQAMSSLVTTTRNLAQASMAQQKNTEKQAADVARVLRGAKGAQ